jgi:hypothetical protein
MKVSISPKPHFAPKYPISITVGEKEYLYESEAHLEGT